MPEPIEYQIVLNLQDALQAISVGGGYHYTVQGTAVKLDPNHDVEALIAPTGARPYIVLELGKEEWEYEPANQMVLRIPVTIHWVHDSTPTTDESLMQTYFRGCADVEQAIAVDIGRGGLATDTRIVDRHLNRDVDGALVWAEIATVIRLHRTYGQPNS